MRSSFGRLSLTHECHSQFSILSRAVLPAPSLRLSAVAASRPVRCRPPRRPAPSPYQPFPPFPPPSQSGGKTGGDPVTRPATTYKVTTSFTLSGSLSDYETMLRRGHVSTLYQHTVSTDNT